MSDGLESAVLREKVCASPLSHCPTGASAETFCSSKVEWVVMRGSGKPRGVSGEGIDLDGGSFWGLSPSDRHDEEQVDGL